MAVISIFKTSGAGQVDPQAATNYLYGSLCSLTDEQKKEYSDAYQLLKLAKETHDIQTEWEANYILQQQKGKRREPLPESINGNRKAVEYAIEHNQHKHKYVSGVIAHALEDTEKLQTNPEVEAEWRELFEELCFAGFPKDQRLIDWVRHTHQGNIENHFLIPRIHLGTGLSFNPAPPGHESDFNLLRDYLNLKHDLASPLDAIHRRLTLDGSKVQKRYKLKQKINNWVTDMVCNNRINSRFQIVEALSHEKVKHAFGITHISESDNFLRVHFKDKKNLRLKGFVFTRGFTSKESLSQSQEPIKSKEVRLLELKEKLNKAIAKRASYNKNRYSLEHSQPQKDLNTHDSLEPKTLSAKRPSIQVSQSCNDFTSMPEFNKNLTGWDMVIQLERRKFIAEQIALEAQKSQHDRQLKLIKDLIHLLKKEKQYESHRETVSKRTHYIDERSADFERAIAWLSESTERILPQHDQTNHSGISERTKDNIDRYRSDPSIDSKGIPRLNTNLRTTIDDIKRSIRIHSTANQEVGASLEHAENIAERQRHIYLKLARAFDILVSKPELKMKLTKKLIDSETRTASTPKSTLDRTLNRIRPQKHVQQLSKRNNRD
ncbi:relaxase/mobilization nuclease domain-containing protein [Vibrio methylphosphonaticus]|uniref:relaxase/mobilization nuclease domain-containing protein n=1 Tax=Vibrio methylphosphonaticus TaxID=2946866 RepID=UPI002029C104|nr:relaxase/mobilization nuclease domain-containing protein [Vibrio methylphosphonaticus]MCL9774591.1 relaxase/mobilization nuclease domain-containing protein [Vibrio methylphosphonaticus]